MELKTKNRIVIWLIAALLLAGGVGTFLALHRCGGPTDTKGSDPDAPVRLFSNGESNPLSDSLLCLNSTFFVTFGSDTAYVVIDSLVAGFASGRYYPLYAQENVVSPHSWCLMLHRKSIEIRTEDMVFSLDLDDTEIEPVLDGNCHKVPLKDGGEVVVSVFDYIEPAFHEYDDTRLRKSQFQVLVRHNIIYGRADGYWTSMVGNEGEGLKAIISDWLKKDHHITSQQLSLDLYCPTDTIVRSHPLILFLHGGAFLMGDKSDSSIVRWCRYFASLGYVTASINYRMGFPISKEGIERTGYMAVQDAHAAMRYLLATDTIGLIDRAQLFVAGSSAGSITALNLAFMTNATRPKTSYKIKTRYPDLGNIESSGNEYDETFHICGIANMWGAVTDLDLLADSHTPIISFHGNQDRIVPYDKGHPFEDVSNLIGKRLFGMMYGSAAIHRYAKSHGLRSQLVTFDGYGHSPHVDADNVVIPENFNRIQQEMQTFFYRTLVPVEPAITVGQSARYYTLNGNYPDVEWQAKGGIILSMQNGVEVVWLADAPAHQLKASFIHPSSLQYTLSQTIDQ